MGAEYSHEEIRKKSPLAIARDGRAVCGALERSSSVKRKISDVLNGRVSSAEQRSTIVHHLPILLMILVVIGEYGCAIKPIPLTADEVQSRANEDRAVLTRDQEPLSGPVDLYEAMARALKYNLDARVELMHKMLAQTQLDLSHYAMLPRLAANAGFDGRNNFPGGVAQSLITGRQVLEPFTSVERNIFSADLSLSWNVLDFGLSYIRAKQAADDVLIADEERRRVANRIMQDVRTAYWRAVSADRILPSLKLLDEWVKTALDKAQAVQDERLTTPLVPLQYKLDHQYATIHSTAVPGTQHRQDPIGCVNQSSS